MSLVDLTRGRSAAPLPTVLVQGLPDAGGSELLDSVRATYPHLRVAYVSAKGSRVERGDCSQCHLVQSLLEAIAQIPIREFDRLWIDVPPLLDISNLTAALDEEPRVAVHLIATCLDASRLLDDIANDRTLAESCDDAAVAGLPVDTTGGEVSILEPLSGFIETCDLIWLHGSDPEGSARRLVCRLNPRATVSSSIGEVAKALMYPRQRFHPEKTFAAAAWKQALARDSNSSHDCFRARRPFHPERFDNLVTGWPDSILRSFGSVWLAMPRDDAIVIDQFGPAGFFVRPDGRWLAGLPAREVRDLLHANPDLRDEWDPVWGDRMTELAFVAEAPLTNDWSRALEACLLTDLELRMDWSRFPNPFAELWDESLHDADDEDDAAELAEHTARSSPPLTLLPRRRSDPADP